MAEFLTTSETSSTLEKIIMNAKVSLCLVSPFLRLSEPLYLQLKEASERGVKIVIVYGKQELSNQEQHQLFSLKNIHSYFYFKLNAKCYFNENEMLFTSMNMNEFSGKHYLEMGIYIHKDQDLRIFKKALDETNSIIRSAEKK